MFFVPAIGTITLIVIVVVVLLLCGGIGGSYYGRRGPYDGV